MNVRICRRVGWGVLAFYAVCNLCAQEAVWHKRLETTEREAWCALNVQMDQRQGLRIRVSEPETHRYMEIRVAGNTTTYQYFPATAFPESLRKATTSLPCQLLKEGQLWFVLKRAARGWTAYLEGRPVARLPELWSGALELLLPDANMPPEDEADEYVQKLAGFRFEDDFMVPEGSEFPQTWERMGGTWRLHSVTGLPAKASSHQLARQPLPQKSPNFYTMEGGGSNAALLAGEPFYSHYQVRASVQHNSGTNGILFLAEESGGYYAFTARTDPNSSLLLLDLWQQPSNSNAPAVFIETVRTALTAGQWLMLEARLFDNRIICLADRIEVINTKLPLAPGGRFGLFANMPEGEVTRFDDVAAFSHQDRILDSPDEVVFATRHRSSGVEAFSRRGTAWIYLPGSGSGTNVWKYGSECDGGLRQETHFVSAADEYACGLSCGVEADATARYRFTCEQSTEGRRYVLELITSTNTVVLDTCAVSSQSNRVTLAMDALRVRELRCYADGQMVCFDRMGAGGAGGVLGVWGLSGDDLFFTAPSVYSQDMVMGERFEKNPLYVNDPFMRHWASPEGQWITYEDGMTWFKGDVIGPVKVRLPVVNGMELHLSVPEGSSNGLCRVCVDEEAISLSTPESGTNAAFSVPAAAIPEVEVGDQKVRLFTVGSEGLVVWLGGDDELYGKAHLHTPLSGRRLRIAGVEQKDLSRTLVKRDNVFDTLFTESLHNWIINGGRWEVINRFYCEPTWSHMNGESADSLAALWSKYVFSGDFCVEFYAGMRMGWYQRTGDLNLTIMSRANATCDGYTAIATGWDPDHSQLYSKLLRNGEPMEITDKYLVPRAREGNVRRGYQPIVARGRDVHGAWYGMNLRRTGQRLQYIYDNEMVFDVNDPEPLQDGSLGIWTYRNSMMVARIKIAAESIKPRPFWFEPVTPGLSVSTPLITEKASGLRVNSRVVQPLAPQYWEAYDTVSHPNVQFSGLDTRQPVMRVTSTLGGGTYLVRCDLPPTLPEKLLGWRFEVARHPRALINFEFSTVKESGQGEFTTVREWTYVLSGTDESRGPRVVMGKLKDFPPTPPGESELVWTPVEIWIPSETIRDNHAVRIDGFGNLQPSYVQEGLLGNHPGVWYAVRGFREIHRGIPVLSGAPNKKEAVQKLAELINALPPGKLQMVEVPAEIDTRQPVIEWAIPELVSFGLKAQVDPQVPGSIVVQPQHPWPSPLLPPRKVLADANPASFQMDGDNLRVMVPLEYLQPDRMTLALELADGRYLRQVVDMRGEMDVNHPPVLMGLEMPYGGLESFEARPGVVEPYKGQAVAEIDYISDPAQGGFLRLRNGGVYGRRLSSVLAPKFDTTATPILQFRYKGDPMAMVSLRHGQGEAFSFAEAFGACIRYSAGKRALMDNQWHTWVTVPSDGWGEVPLSQYRNRAIAPVRVASCRGSDQTGLHSELWIDDLVRGPAVGPERPFAFKAEYVDPDGVAEVLYALISGSEPYDARASKETSELVWHPAGNNVVIEPSLEGLLDGLHHLLVKARDTRGAWSRVTDIAFVLDRHPPAVTHKVERCDNYNGSSLQLSIVDPHAPPVMHTLRLSSQGTELDIATDRGVCRVGQGALVFEFDWIWLLRDKLRDAKHGDNLPLIVSGIVDASGNAREPYQVDLSVDLESDKRPPTVLPFKRPKNALLLELALKRVEPLFAISQNLKTGTEMSEEGHVLQVVPARKGAISLRHDLSPAWDPDKHPYLAISYRVLEVEESFYPFNIAFSAGKRRPRGITDMHLIKMNQKEAKRFIMGDAAPVAGKWHNVIINVRDFLRTESEDGKSTPDLRYMTLAFHNKARGAKVQLRSMAILAPWEKEHIIPLQAYDLSGVRGLVWEDGSSELTVIRPAALPERIRETGCFAVRVSDRRGNLSDTYVVPIPPGGSSDTGGLSAFQAME